MIILFPLFFVSYVKFKKVKSSLFIDDSFLLRKHYSNIIIIPVVSIGRTLTSTSSLAPFFRPSISVNFLVTPLTSI